jgi:hypothetical protein
MTTAMGTSNPGASLFVCPAFFLLVYWKQFSEFFMLFSAELQKG